MKRIDTYMDLNRKSRNQTIAYRGASIRYAAFVSLVSIFSFSLHADESGGNTGFDFLRSEIGARPAALAGAFTAASGDLNGLFHNPASLCGLDRREASFTYINHVFDFQSGFVGYSQKVPGAGQAAIGLSYMNYGKFTWRDILGEETGSSTPFDWVLNAAYADSLPFHLRYGVSLKYIRSTIADYWSDALALSFGVIVSIPSQRLNIGAGIFNAGRGLHAFLGRREHLPLSYRVGFSKRLAHLPLMFNADLIRFHYDESSLPGGLYWAIGGEFTLSEHVFMRWGYHSRGREEKEVGNNRFAGVTFGLGLQFGTFTLDGGLNQFGMLGTINQFTITKSF